MVPFLSVRSLEHWTAGSWLNTAPPVAPLLTPQNMVPYEEGETKGDVSSVDRLPGMFGRVNEAVQPQGRTAREASVFAGRSSYDDGWKVSAWLMLGLHSGRLDTSISVMAPGMREGCLAQSAFGNGSARIGCNLSGDWILLFPFQSSSSVDHQHVVAAAKRANDSRG